MVDIIAMDKKLLEAEVVRCRALNKIYASQMEVLVQKMKSNNKRRELVELELKNKLELK